LTAVGTQVAIVHDYLTQRGGAERVVMALHRALPEAPVYTSLYEPVGTFPEFAGVEVHAAPLNAVALLRGHHRAALPLLAPTFSAMRIDAEIVICSSSGWSHGVRTSGRKVVYCHAPARWLYQTESYLDGTGGLAAAVLGCLAPLLRTWDRRAARSADLYLANSRYTQRLIKDAYGIECAVVVPPVGVGDVGTQEVVPGIEPGYFLSVSRLLAYKNVDAIVEAFSRVRAEQLVVVGSGPLEAVLRQGAPSNVKFLPVVTDSQLRWLYANARALIAASYEDFGLTPIEAAAFGTPSIVLRFGGYLDTVREGRTGLFFDEPEPGLIATAIATFDEDAYDACAIRAHCDSFSEATFQARIREAVGVELPGRIPR
jgi:glycosyltransferase involved in cell wall biosynthesis